jgi:hypothetical protein
VTGDVTTDVKAIPLVIKSEDFFETTLYTGSLTFRLNKSQPRLTDNYMAERYTTGSWDYTPRVS